jgi:hypothetical protein
VQLAATGQTRAAAAPQIKLSSHGYSIGHPDPELGEQLMADALGVALLDHRVICKNAYGPTRQQGRRRAFMAAAAASCASTTSSRRNHLWRLHIERTDLRSSPFDLGSSFVGWNTGLTQAEAIPAASRSYVCWTSECNALTAASRFSTGTNRLTECGDNTYMSGTIP